MILTRQLYYGGFIPYFFHFISLKLELTYRRLVKKKLNLVSFVKKFGKKFHSPRKRRKKRKVFEVFADYLTSPSSQLLPSTERDGRSTSESNKDHNHLRKKTPYSSSCKKWPSKLFPHSNFLRTKMPSVLSLSAWTGVRLKTLALILFLLACSGLFLATARGQRGGDSGDNSGRKSVIRRVITRKRIIPGLTNKDEESIDDDNEPVADESAEVIARPPQGLVLDEDQIVARKIVVKKGRRGDRLKQLQAVAGITAKPVESSTESAQVFVTRPRKVIRKHKIKEATTEAAAKNINENKDEEKVKTGDDDNGKRER